MTRAHWQFILAMFIFGFNGVLAHWIPFESYQIVLARTSIGAIFLFLILLFKQHRFVFRQHLKSFYLLMLSGAMMGCNWMFLYEAFQQAGIGLAQVLNSSGPVLAVLLSLFIFRETFHRFQMISLVLVILGMLLISQPEGTAHSSVGILLGICSSLSYAGLLISNRLARSIHGMERTMWQLTFATVVVGLFLMFKGTGLPELTSIRVILPVVMIGVVGTGIGMNFMFAGLRSLNFQTTGVLFYLEPFSALIFAALFLGERLTRLEGLGSLLIVSGTLFSEWSTWRVNQRTEPVLVTNKEVQGD